MKPKKKRKRSNKVILRVPKGAKVFKVVGRKRYFFLKNIEETRLTIRVVTREGLRYEVEY